MRFGASAMNYTDEQKKIIDEVNVFCDETITEEKIAQWVKSRGVPASVNKRFHNSVLGSYCLPTNVGALHAVCWGVPRWWNR